MAVKKISNETIQRIREKSVEKMPDIVKNISPQELKRRFTGISLDANTSIISEINRIVDEVNIEIKSNNAGNIIISEDEPTNKAKDTIWIKIL